MEFLLDHGPFFDLTLLLLLSFQFSLTLDLLRAEKKCLIEKRRARREGGGGFFLFFLTFSSFYTHSVL